MTFLWFATKLVKEIFGVSVVTLLLLLIAEDVKTGLVLNYFELSKLFVFCMLIGGVYLVLSKFEDASHQH